MRHNMRHNRMQSSLSGLLCGLLTLVIMAPAYDVVLAGEKEDMAAMQKALNQQTMERPFNPGDKATIDAYLEQALKKGTPPPQQQPPRTGSQAGPVII